MGNAALFFFCVFLGHYGNHLLVYSDTYVSVFEVSSGIWVQTLNLKKCSPVDVNGILGICCIYDLPHILYLKNIHMAGDIVNVGDGQVVSSGPGRPPTRARRRFSIREGNKPSTK